MYAYEYLQPGVSLFVWCLIQLVDIFGKNVDRIQRSFIIIFSVCIRFPTIVHGFLPILFPITLVVRLILIHCTPFILSIYCFSLLFFPPHKCKILLLKIWRWSIFIIVGIILNSVFLFALSLRTLIPMRTFED